MFALLRCGLLIGALAGAFAAGFYLKPAPPIRHVVAAAPAPRPADLPPIHDPQVKPAVVLGAPEPADPLDAAGMAMIRKEMGLQTTILDKTEPVPAVLDEARRRKLKEEENSPQVSRMILPNNVVVAQSPPAEPIPTGGPMPRLDPPPAIPSIIPDVVPPRVPPPPRVRVPPLGSATRPINDRAVALDFGLTRIGSSPVKAVELWTTRDGGATWAMTDRINGCVSPFRTRLGSDGEYGFRLVLESESGLRTSEPKRGDAPDVRLVLDTTPPRVADVSLEPTDAGANQVRVRWTMADADLDRDRVRIEYSTDGQAWRPAILQPQTFDDSPDRFSRIWSVPPGLPHRVMVRVMVHDRAGNTSTAELPKAVSIDLRAPEGRIIGLRRPGPEIGPMPRVVESPARALLLVPVLGSPVLRW